ncbi:helix-turn-helix domain-containing protein [Streptomyces sp. NPDC052179]|uniref:helix-turn-helix domain-containing protein n=1 Tax=Streptomyces sp. NPDC052179 TaxID=3155680 RepID=UPI00343685D8
MTATTKTRVRLRGAVREAMAATLVTGYAKASTRELAARHGLSLGLTQALLREGGATIRQPGSTRVPGRPWPPPVPHRKPAPMTEGRLDLILDVAGRYDDGATVRELVTTHGVAFGTVQRLLRDGGVQMRPRNARQSLTSCY